jgi:hypothetical protein
MEGSKVRETEVSKMMSEVSEVITSHLNNFVDRFEENNKTMVSTVEILKELPIIKDLEDRLAKVTAENTQLKAKIKEMKNNKKHIMLQTEEINVGEVPVSYSEIDALVTTQVQNKSLESTQYSGGLYMDYMANQSDTDTSDSDSADDNDENPEKKWLHTPVQGTLLGTWSEKKDSNKGPAELARDEEGVVEITTKEADKEEEAHEEEAHEDGDEEADEEEADEDDEEEEAEEEDEEEADEDDEEEEAEEEEAEEEDAEAEEEDADEEEEADEEEAEEDDEAEEEEAEEEEDVDEEEEADEEDDEEESEGEDGEELEVEEIEIENVIYYCTNEKDGILFECGEDGEIGDEIGHLQNGTVFFS